jgi:hypothetical protein
MAGVMERHFMPLHIMVFFYDALHGLFKVFESLS